MPILNEVAGSALLNLELEQYQEQLDIPEKPIESVMITFETGLPQRPVGAELLVYPQELCGPDAEGIQKALFNLRALTGFVPPGMD